MMNWLSPKLWKLHLKSVLFILGTYFIIDSYVVEELKILDSKMINDELIDFNEKVFDCILDDYDAYTK